MCPGRPAVARSDCAILPAPKSFAIVQLPRVISQVISYLGGIAGEPACGG